MKDSSNGRVQKLSKRRRTDANKAKRTQEYIDAIETLRKNPRDVKALAIFQAVPGNRGSVPFGYGEGPENIGARLQSRRAAPVASRPPPPGSPPLQSFEPLASRERSDSGKLEKLPPSPPLPPPPLHTLPALVTAPKWQTLDQLLEQGLLLEFFLRLYDLPLPPSSPAPGTLNA